MMKKLFAIAALCYLPLSSMAWGMLGHRIVAEIAGKYLTDKARIAVMKIFGTSSMAMESNWADFIKSDPSYSYLDRWHYIDFDKGWSRVQVLDYLRSDTVADAYTRINFLAKELKNKNLSPDKKLLYLRLLIHIAGDIHQPMHVGRKEDKGGNTVKVMWFNEASNLHRVWDEQLIGYQQLSYTEYVKAIDHPTAEQKSKWQQEPLENWITDSYEISSLLYPEITEPNQKLGYRYNFDHVAQLNEQLLKGGIHLAALLNSIFK